MSVLLGAGASAAAGLPDWDKFAVDLLTASGAITDRDTARAFLSGQDPAIVAEAAKNAASKNWCSVLNASLYGDEPIAPAPLHTATAALAVHRGHDAISLFTLNYDHLLEVALHQVLQDTAQTSNSSVFPRASARPRADRGSYEVHHLHGYFPPNAESAESVVLTLSDYNKLGHQQTPWQAAALAEALQKGPLILAGTSYRDPDIRQWVHGFTSEDSDAVVIVFLTREGLGLSRTQFDHVKSALEEQWSALGVTVIATHDHADAAQALRELPRLDDEDYLDPRGRAWNLWDLHVSGFSSLQSSDSSELDHDLSTLREGLPDFHNLTLWLADGGGKLVRWAANDRVYRDVNHLRRVSPGHDSDWIAGKCIGRNDLLLRKVKRRASTARWLSVAAAPLVPELPGGPPMPCGVISGASTVAAESLPVDEVDLAFAELSEKWTGILQARGGGEANR